MTLCRGESLLKFTTSVLCKQHCYNNYLLLDWERDCKTFTRHARWKQACLNDFWIKVGCSKKRTFNVFAMSNTCVKCAVNFTQTEETLLESWTNLGQTWCQHQWHCQSYLLYCTVALFYSARPIGKSFCLSTQTFACLQTGGGVSPTGRTMFGQESLSHTTNQCP